MLNKILQEQLQQLMTVPFKVDGKSSNAIPEDFNEIVFQKDGLTAYRPRDIRVEFADYILNPFPGFDLHDKWNNGVAPYDKVMYGKITKETEKMFYFEVHSETSGNLWCGWCPKKSCTVK